MMQFLNNIWIALSTENVELVNLMLIPATIIEHYLFMKIFLIIFNVNASRKQKSLYIALIFTISILSSNLIPAPFNIITNYTFMVILIKYVFDLNWLKSLVSLVVPSFIFVLLNILLQNPYLTILNITLETFMNIAILRFPYLILLYILLYCIGLIFKNFKKLTLNLAVLDILDKRTKYLLGINILAGFLTLSVQLMLTTFYIDIVPMSITVLNFVLLLSFFMISIYSFTRIIKLANTTRDLQSAEDYNKSLEIMYDEVKGFKHDFDNIISTLDGFIENNDMSELKNYFYEVKKDCKITNNLSILNPRIVNNAGIYSLLNNKYFKATNLGITFDIEYFLDLNTVDVNLYQLSRILGILIDNAIEEAQKCESKIVKLSFIKETRNNRVVITLKNTYSNKNVDLEKIFDKGESGKENHSGIGLWEVRNYVKKSKNLDLFTNKNDEFFIQELSIYNM